MPLNTNQNTEINILTVGDITEPELIQFLNAKQIDLDLAKRFLHQVEIEFQLTGYHLTVLGLQNRSNGFQLRALNFKGAVLSDISFIDNGQPTLVVVPAMLEFLVALQHHPQVPKPTNWLVLNERQFNEELDDILMQHQDIYLLLGDDDNASGIRKRARKIGFGRSIKIQDLAPLEPNFNTPSERVSNDTLNVAFRPVSKNSEVDHKPRRLRR